MYLYNSLAEFQNSNPPTDYVTVRHDNLILEFVETGGNGVVLTGTRHWVPAPPVVHPGYWGAIRGYDVCSGEAINACIAWVASRFSDDKTFSRNYIIDANGASYRSDISINYAGLEDNSAPKIRNIHILSRASNLPAFDAFGTRMADLENVTIYGDKNLTPLTGMQFGRMENNSFAPAPQARVFKCATYGYFKMTGLLNLGSEVYTGMANQWHNRFVSTQARAAIYSPTADVVKRRTLLDPVSEYVDVMDEADGWTGRTLLNVREYGVDIRRIADIRATITNITRAPICRVVCENDLLEEDGWVEGLKIYLDDIQGMTQVNGKCYRARNINGNSFELWSYTDMLPINASSFNQFISGSVVNATGPAITLGSVGDFHMPSAYILGYSFRGKIEIDLEGQNPAEITWPADIKISGNHEPVTPTIVDFYTTVNRRIYGADFQFVRYVGEDAPFRAYGGGTVRIDKGKFSIFKTGLSASNMFKPANVFDLRDPDIWSGGV